METRSARKKPTIELRYYELPEHEPVLTLTGEDWVRPYGDTMDNLHFHNLMEVGICRWGEGQMVLDEQVVPYQAGVITLIPANCVHTTVSRDGALNYWEYMFFDPKEILRRAFPENELFAEAVARRLSSEAKTLSGEMCGALAQLIQMVLAEYPADAAYHAETVQSLLTALLLKAARLYASDGSGRHVSNGLQQIMPALEYINRHYMNSLLISDLAEQCLLSEAHLRRKFKEYLNMSPNDYLTMVRVRRGCDLLNTTACTMQEVALRVGYQSISSFDRNFQKLTGMSPYQYKKKSKDYKGKLLDYRISAKKGW